MHLRSPMGALGATGLVASLEAGTDSPVSIASWTWGPRGVGVGGGGVGGGLKPETRARRRPAGAAPAVASAACREALLPVPTRIDPAPCRPA
jgi:hypothetical protein